MVPFAHLDLQSLVCPINQACVLRAGTPQCERIGERRFMAKKVASRFSTGHSNFAAGDTSVIRTLSGGGAGSSPLDISPSIAAASSFASNAATTIGECPRLAGGSCAQRCRSDRDCASVNAAVELKCCSNGCGNECVQPLNVAPLKSSLAIQPIGGIGGIGGRRRRTPIASTIAFAFCRPISAISTAAAHLDGAHFDSEHIRRPHGVAVKSRSRFR